MRFLADFKSVVHCGAVFAVLVKGRNIHWQCGIHKQCIKKVSLIKDQVQALHIHTKLKSPKIKACRTGLKKMNPGPIKTPMQGALAFAVVLRDV